MEYPWKDSFKAIPIKGVPRMIELIKLTLHEIPRLHEEYNSEDSKARAKAKREASALLAALNEEMPRCRSEAKLPPEEFAKAVQQYSHFTPEEQQALILLPPFLKAFGLKLF